MDKHAASRKLSMQEASDAVTGLGWRYVLGVLRTYVRAGSLAQAADVARRVVAAAGPDADACLQLDVRRDGLVLTLQSLDTNQVTAREAEVARRISAAVTELGLATDAGVGGPRSRAAAGDRDRRAGHRRRPPVLESGHGLRRPAGGVRARGRDSPTRSGRARRSGTSRWTRRGRSATASTSTSRYPMTRRQARIQAALDAGGTARLRRRGAAFWVLADPEGNEACVTTWQGRE